MKLCELALFILILSSQAAGMDISWESQFGHAYFHKTETNNTANTSQILNSQTYANLQFKTDFQFENESALLFLAKPDLQWNWDSTYLDKNQQKTALWNLNEIYSKYTNGDFKFIAGKNIISWGSSDILNPVDFFGARDMTLLSSQTEKNRKGITGFRGFLTTTISEGLDLQSELVMALSDIKNTSLILQNPNWGLSVNDTGQTEQTTPLSLGLKTGLFTDYWDVSLFLYNGQYKRSEKQILEILPITIQIGSVHQNIKAIGLDASYVFHKWIFRTEASYQQIEMAMGQRNLKSPDLGEIVIGLERPVGEHFQIQGQVYQRQQFNYPENNLDLLNPLDALTSSLQIYNDQLNGFTSESEFGWTLRLNALLFDDRLEFQNSVMTFLESKGSFFRSSLKWSGIQNLNLTLGTVQYSAESSSPLFQMKQLSHIFTEVSYIF